MIKAILFDAAGTLIHLPRGVGWHYRHVAARHGLDLDESRMAAAFAEAFRAAGPRVATGVSRPDDDKGWWRVLVRRAMTACGEGPEDAVFEPMFEELYAHFAEPGVWALYPEVLAVLEALRGHYRLGIVSNFDRRLYPVLEASRQCANTSRQLSFPANTAPTSPIPRIFAAALRALDASPGEALHVGDDPEQDWRAAEAAGLRVYRLARPGNSLESVPAFAGNL